MSGGANYLDPDRPEAVRLSVGDARALGEAALARFGYVADDARIITDQLIDNALSGYRFAGLPRILAIAREAKTRDTRVPVAALDNQADIAKVQEWLGHANIATTRIYDHRKIRPEDSPTFKVNY
jgi:LDH2 family malate/lactate/ureidoglycolate dehydrogenase